MVNWRSWLGGPASGETEISAAKQRIIQKSAGFEALKRTHGEKTADQKTIQYIDAERGKTVELNAEQLNVNLETMMTETQKAEEELNKSLYGGLFGGARKWFAENVVEKFGIKIEDFRVVKGAAKFVGGIGAFLFGLGHLNPLAAAFGAKTAFDGIVESAKYLHEGKYIRAMRSAVCEKFKVIDEMAQLRNKTKEEAGVGGDLVEVNEKVDLGLRRGPESIAKVMEGLITRTKDIDKAVLDNFPILRKLEKNYGAVRFWGGLATSLGVGGWIAAKELAATVAQHAAEAAGTQATQTAVDLGKEGLSFGGWHDYDKINGFHEAVKYNDAVTFVYNESDVVAKSASGGWKLFESLDEAQRYGYIVDSKKITDLGVGLHHLANGTDLNIVSAIDPETGKSILIHAVNSTPHVNDAVSSAATAGLSHWDYLKTFGGVAMYSVMTGILEGTTAAAKSKEAEEPTPSLAAMASEPTKTTKEADLDEKFYKELFAGDVVVSDVGGTKRYYAIIKKLPNNKILIREVNPKNGEFVVGSSEETKDKNFLTPAHMGPFVKNDKSLEGMQEEIKQKNKEEWDKWLENHKNVAEGNYFVLAVIQNLTHGRLRDIQGRVLFPNVEWIIEEINMEKQQVRLKRKVPVAGRRGHQSVETIVGLDALQDMVENHHQEISFFVDASTRPNTPGVPGTQDAEPEYIRRLQERSAELGSNIPDDIISFKKLKAALWRYEAAPGAGMKYWKVTNKNANSFQIEEYNLQGNRIPNGEMHWIDQNEYINDVEFIKYV